MTDPELAAMVLLCFQIGGLIAMYLYKWITYHD